MKHIDATGKKYGRWTVIKRDEIREKGKMIKGKRKAKYYICKCDCGTIKSLCFSGLQSGHDKSCGCLRKEIMTKHGMRYTKQYKKWRNMKTRCLSKSIKDYKYYKEKGIRVCSRWEKSFENFWEDMKTGYRDGLEIDRIDNNKGYFKENCRWVTKKQQASNKTSNIQVTINGQKSSLTELAEIFGLKYSILWRRLYRYNLPLGKALYVR